MSSRSVITRVADDRERWRAGRIVGVGFRLGTVAGLVFVDECSRRVLPRAVADRASAVLGKWALDSLGRLRGPWVKAAQAVAPLMASPFWREVARLRDRGRPASKHAVRRVLTDEIGPIDEVFRSIDWAHPLGVASIGQVHRAQLIDGTDVAVKVQHRCVRDDLTTDLAVLRRVASLLTRWCGDLDASSLVDEVAAHLERELDYEAEAASHRVFAARYEDHDRISVPRVLRATPRVLVTELSDARPLTDPTLPVALRDAAGAAVFEFWLCGLATHREIQIDVHSGNFLVDDRGHLVALDFGQVRQIDEGTAISFTQLARWCAAADDADTLAAAFGAIAASPTAQFAADLVELAHALHDVLHHGGHRRLERETTAAVMRKFAMQTVPHLALPASTLVLLRSLAGTLTVAGVDLEAAAPWSEMVQEHWFDAFTPSAA